MRAKLAVIDEYGILDPDAKISEASLPSWLSESEITQRENALDQKAGKSELAEGLALKVAKGELVRNVKDYGAVGDNVADDTVAVAAAIAAAGAGTVYFPRGTYKVSSLPDLPNYSSLAGEGEASVVSYTGTETMAVLLNKSRVRFSHMKFVALTATAKLFHLQNSFRCGFTRVVFQGQHTTVSGATYRGQTAVHFSANAGDTTIADCDILNFGVGVQADSIQNFLYGCKVGTCYYGVAFGTGGGLSIESTDFVSGFVTDGSTNHPVESNIYAPGQAGQIWIHQTWMEGANNPIKIGAVGGQGPSQFSISDSKVAGTGKCITLNSCRQPKLENVQFSLNPGTTGGSPLHIETAVLEGYAENLVDITGAHGYHIPASVFPNAWIVMGRGRAIVPSLFSKPDRPALNVIADSAHTGELAMFIGKSGVANTRMTPEGTFYSFDATKGYILRSANGKYWRLTVDDEGALSTTDLGTARPLL